VATLTRPTIETPAPARIGDPAPAINPAQPNTAPGLGTRTEPAPLRAPQISGDAPHTGVDEQPHQPAPAPTTVRPVRPGGQPDGPPTVGGGEKARGNRYDNGQLHQWDEDQQQWRPIARDDGVGAQTAPKGLGPTGAAKSPPSIQAGDLDTIFHGQPGERERYEQLSRKPANELSPEEGKFVHATREQQRVERNETMTKVMKQADADKMINGTYRPDVVRGFVARARDADQLRTPQELRDGLGLDDSYSVARGADPWSAIPKDAPYAYQLRWRAPNGADRMRIPYGAASDGPVGPMESQVQGPLARQDPPFTGTGTTPSGVPEWVADDAPLGNFGEFWRIDRDGKRELYSRYDPQTNTWSPPR
jgi:hypothetical protein